MADSIIDTSLARALAEGKASGTAPAKGTPEGDALRRAAKRVDPKGAIQKEIRADYRARSAYGTADADRLTDARIAARIQRAFSPAASAAVKERAKSDPVLANTIANIEGPRAAIRAELARVLPTQAAKAIADMDSGTGDDDVNTCPLCGGTGEAPTATTCLACEGLGVVLPPDSDDEIAAAIAQARSIKRLAKRLVKKAGPDASVMAKGTAPLILSVTDSKRAAKLSPREAAAFRRAAAKALGVPAERLTVKVQ
jgi:hypothetical protein